MTPKQTIELLALLTLATASACGSPQRPVPNDEVTTRVLPADEAALAPDGDNAPDADVEDSSESDTP